MRHKLIVVISIVIGGAVWACAANVLRASDGSSGISLVSAQASPVTAAVVTVLYGLPAIVLGLVAVASRKAASGILVTAVSLCLLAIAGGEQAGWMYRADLPGEYGRLIVEMIVWQVGLVVVVLLYQHFADPMRRRFPALIDSAWRQGLDVNVLHWDRSTILGGVICSFVAWIVAGLLMRTSSTGQIVGALIAGFGFGGFMAQLILPRSNPVGVIFSPMVVAIAAYALVLYRFEGRDEVLAAWYRLGGADGAMPARLPALAMALPIHFISAGVAGCCLGAGLGHGSNLEQGVSSSFAAAVMRTFSSEEDNGKKQS